MLEQDFSGPQRRTYFSARRGQNAAVARFDLEQLRRLVSSTFTAPEEEGFFQQAFGYSCVDAGEVPGEVGSDVNAYILRRLRKDQMWPLVTRIAEYSEEDVFDMIELLHDHASKPLEGRHHDYASCGWHYSSFDRAAGREAFRAEINDFLTSYDAGYELSDEGEVVHLADPGLQPLLEAKLPVADSKSRTNVEGRVAGAIRKFRRHGASVDDRRDAVRSLADVLEYLRPQVKRVLTSKDEGDLFNIANNFGIRHHNDAQKTQYEQDVWLSWMFYFYLATIHVVMRRVAAGHPRG
ncbi:MAG: hypothetical protein M3323_01070 [Actinomycetota bacterium]|nr:hypothetical protein [Actinomycetota bacterium]